MIPRIRITRLNDFAEMLSPEASEDLMNSIHKGRYPRGTTLLSPGQTNEWMHFIEKGIARSYLFTDEADGPREVTSWISAEGETAFSPMSFYRQTPATEYIEVLEDSLLFSLHYTQFYRLQREYPDYFGLVMKLTEESVIKHKERSQMLRFRSPRQRFQVFEEVHPHLRGRLSQKVIASYINVSYHEISRVRKKLTPRLNTPF
ncbi:Crp/Fnr family transcriptional regulator [Siphonobacter aquaeclarae]|uniref:cAMP-binding domain of CRP or a regulatory subunit of cAMP-dependent protein kinases n=1 Tax=Siphonobacter aquaeclarae TaxID=563176 RepID=A0A1G9N6F3_9BACT|nr:Crp/Fnr family transcriptional regulator [Siphonobacter aquaeclarae]SDL81984.1 cAMP-binding domain of CRP or a regulatory subunit of cAMP-dependent protein kinases [Siphonobacter aquaeclarae]